jgi:MinD-like ATPase involved in chromosome partitioning or flagellar assembly
MSNPEPGDSDDDAPASSAADGDRDNSDNADNVERRAAGESGPGAARHLAGGTDPRSTGAAPTPARPDAPPAPPNIGARHLERPARHDPEGLSEKTSLINRDELLAGPPARAPHPQQGGEWAAAGTGWGQSHAGAADFSFLNDIRSAELVPTRRIPPRRGWRKGVYASTFHLINPGQSPDERHQAELENKVRSLLRGRYKIGVLGKGGVGKTTISACVGSILAQMRPDDRVVAIDADTAFGKLASRIDPKASGSYWELAGDRNLHSFADVRSRVGSNASGLFVLAGEMSSARRRVLDPAVYRAATAALDKHFTVSIVDCGSAMDTPVTRAAVSDLDALIVVSSCWYDGASAAGQTLEWLANNGYTGLLHRTVVVVNNSDNQAGKRDVKLLVERFGSRGQKVIEMPYDRHLRPAGVIDVDNELNKLTRRRLLELAAGLAEHFAATTDRPRERR